MSQKSKLFLKILSGNSDNNINFSELVSFLISLGFELRIKGDHYIFSSSEMDEIINLQPLNNKAKPYQLKQVRNLIIKYKLFKEENE
ncbi:MAG: toxin HicA [Ignavibacteria bacterium GWF2_33_9]|nr:MAG: toxin HicA [Ignavibacteria bacterium GWF2_33_9]